MVKDSVLNCDTAPGDTVQTLAAIGLFDTNFPGTRAGSDVFLFVAPLSVLVTQNVAVELRLTTGIVWEDKSWAFFSVDLGILIRG